MTTGKRPARSESPPNERPEKAQKRGGDKTHIELAVSVDDATLSAVLWSNPNATVPGNHQLFATLTPEVNFENLREALCAYTRTFEVFVKKSLRKNLYRLRIDEILVLAMNDYACRTGNSGRMVHCRAHACSALNQTGMLVYFAGRGWSMGHQKYYAGRSPVTRYHLSGAYAGYHWKDPETPVLQVRIAKMEFSTKDATFKGRIYLPVERLEEARSKYGQEVVVFWLDKKLFCVKLLDILNLDQMTGYAYDRPSPDDAPRLRVHESGFSTSINGYLNCEFWYMPNSTQCQEWAKGREITTESLVEGLYERLLHEFLEEGDKTTVRAWKTALSSMKSFITYGVL